MQLKAHLHFLAIDQPSTGAPLAYYVITAAVAGLALIVSLFNLWWTQHKTDEREMTKWRRDTLTKAVLEYIETVEEITKRRNEYLTDRSFMTMYEPVSRKILELAERLEKTERVIRLCDMTSIRTELRTIKSEIVDADFSVSELQQATHHNRVDDWITAKMNIYASIEPPDHHIKSIESKLQKELGIKV